MSSPDSTQTPWGRLRGYYQSLSLALRLAVALGIVLAASAVGYWTILPPRADWVYLMGGQEFSERQMHAFSQALEAEGLSDFRIDAARLRVPRGPGAHDAAGPA